ncbi:MAG: tetratricopeptide repeat protein, partial [Desulfobulbaceae bacterium]|nr:tetratricopeptide repeat protein [Desulfobulbaceae bacterium]
CYFIFFLNHLIESTAWPLELIFEHRNYLPSLFLFWPISFFIVSKVNHHSRLPNQIIVYGILLSIFTLLTSWTFERNTVWQTEQSLCQDTNQKAPKQARAVYCLALLAANEGDYPKAIQLYKKSLTLTAPSPATFQSLALLNLADMHLAVGNYDEALENYAATMKFHPNSSLIIYKLAFLYYLKKDFTRSKEYLNQLVNIKKDGPQTHWLLGKIYLITGKTDAAIKAFSLSLSLNANNITAANDLALSLFISEKKASALEIIKSINARKIDNCTTMLLEILTLGDNSSKSLDINTSKVHHFNAMCSESEINLIKNDLINSGIHEDDFSFLNYIEHDATGLKNVN